MFNAKENRYRTLADAMPQIVWEANAQGRLTYTNQRWTDYSGCSNPEKWFDFVFAEDQVRVADQWSACVASGTPYESEFRLLRQSDQLYRWHLVRAEPVYDAQGKVAVWYGTCTDITDQKAQQQQKTAALDALRKAEDRLSRAMRTSRLGFWDLELPVGSVTMSQQMADDWGVDLDRFGGTLDDTLHLIHQDDFQAIRLAITQSMETGNPFCGMFRVPQKSGNDVWIESRAEGIRDENGSVIRFSGTSIDISERIRQQKAEEVKAAEFIALAELAPQLLFTAEPDGGVTYCNEPFYAYTGESPDDMKGWGWNRIVHPEHLVPTLERWTTAVKAEVPYQMEYLLRRYDGKFRWHLARARPVRDSNGRVVKWLGACTDIHEQKEISRNFELAKEVAEAANSAKSAFLTNMSHEIRTPIGIILGFAELLRKQELDELDRLDFAGTIIRNGRHLLELLSDILDLSKVEAGKLFVEKERISLVEIMSELDHFLQPTSRAKGIRFSINTDGSVPKYICTDPTRLRQILLNVIGNALKFTEEGQVDVTLRLSSRTAADQRNLEFVVKDSGCGIEQSKTASLFQPFVQADNTNTRKYGGTGLGLALSAQLAKALGGQLELSESTFGKGSSFTVTVPVEETETEDSFSGLIAAPVAFPQLKGGINTKVQEQLLHGIRVLIVEDTIDNQRMISRFLKLAGAEVATASNGNEGVKRALAEHFDVVLMDIQMPVLDGFQATALLRQKGYPAPIVALTAHAMADERQRCLESGCTDILTKPIDPVLLVQTIADNVKIAVAGLSQDSIDDDFMAEILQKFLQSSLPRIFQEIELAIEKGDYEAVGRNAHKIAGSIAVYSTPAFAVTARQLEKESKNSAEKSTMNRILGELIEIHSRLVAT